MLNPTSVDDQVAQAQRDDLRVLIIGAGVAGVTAAQLLRHQGRHPVLVERNRDEGHPGYMLALMPMVDAALAELGVQESYRQASTPLGRYGFHAHTGKAVRTDTMAGILDTYGDYRGISRAELMEVLTSAGGPIAYGTTVTDLQESGQVTIATFSGPDGPSEAEFDLVIVSDGIHSATRRLVFDQMIDTVDTRWGGWVVWADADADMDLGEEFWGAGFFVGVYPVKDRLGVFIGGPTTDLQESGPRAVAADIRRRLTTVSPRLDRSLRALVDDPDPFFWKLSDIRSPQWATDRIVLLGDAAAGFLPTAGIGAGMAMESAWVLAGVLRQATPTQVPTLLRAYEKAQRPRVESAQSNSRGLAYAMFSRSTALAVIREVAMRLISVKVALRPIQQLLASPPDPDGIAREAVPLDDAVRNGGNDPSGSAHRDLQDHHGRHSARP